VTRKMYVHPFITVRQFT